MKRLLLMSLTLVVVIFALPVVLMWGHRPLAGVASAAEGSGEEVVVTDEPEVVSVETPTAPPDEGLLVVLERGSAAGVDVAAAVDETIYESTADSDITVRLVTSGGVRTLTLDEYLPHAVYAEMAPSFGAEALKAQAVACRTFVYNSILSAKSGRGKHTSGDICASPSCCMGYKSASSDAINDAVTSTDGQVMLYDDKPILAAFHSSAGGRTKDAQAVWGGYVSYLTAVDSPDGNVGKNGHGVGMSQYGAKAMAEDGAEYEEILTHYYAGAVLGGYEVD